MMVLIALRVGDRRYALIARRDEARRHVLAEQRECPVLQAAVAPGGAARVVSGKPTSKLTGQPISSRAILAEANAGESNVMDRHPA